MAQLALKTLAANTATFVLSLALIHTNFSISKAAQATPIPLPPPVCVGMNAGNEASSSNYGGVNSFVANGPDSQTATYTLKVRHATFQRAVITINDKTCAATPKVRFDRVAQEGDVTVFRGAITYGQVKNCNFNWDSSRRYLQLNGYAGNPTDPKCIAYAALVQPTPPPTSGFNAEFFNNMGLSGPPVLTRFDQNINFNWGNDSPDPKINPDRFSARWTGTINLPAGRYRFSVTADDGVRLRINNQTLIDQWRDQPPTTYQAVVDLSAGNQQIVMEYYENTVGAVARLWWERI